MGDAAESVRREELRDIAGLARDLKRTNDMFVCVNTVAKMGIELNLQEKYFLFVAYRTIFSDKYETLRRIYGMLEQEDDPICVECLVFYLGWLEEDMKAICRTTVDVVNRLLASCPVEANTTLYEKMKGDACWFLYMLNKEEDKELLAREVFAAHEDASKSKAAEGMSPVHPKQLTLPLTKTAFNHDDMKLGKRAIDLGKKALEEGHEAFQKLPSLDEEFYEQRAEIMKLMGENLKLRMSDPKIKGPGPDENTLEPLLETAPSPYSKGSPSSPAVIPRPIGPPMAPNDFTSPGDWSYQAHERNALNEIMSRKKAAQPSRKDKAEGEGEADTMVSVLRKGLAFVASITQKLGHSSVMLETVNMLAELNLKLTPKERDLLSTIYKEVFSKKYKDLRAVFGSEEDHVQAYRWMLEDEMEITCRNVLNILQNHLLPFCCGAQEDDVVLYTKMVGDINWFLAMLSKVQNKESHVKSTLTAYWDACKAAVVLSPAHPQRLALHLTIAAFYNDVKKRDKLAIDLGKAALDQARPLLNSLDEESRKESVEIMKLLDENLKLWIEAADEENDSLEPSSLDTSAPYLQSSSAAAFPSRGARLQRFRHLLQAFLQAPSVL